MIAALYSYLVHVTLCTAIAIACAAVVRRPLRRVHPAAAYAAWLLVPAMGLACLLPAPTLPGQVITLTLPLARATSAALPGQPLVSAAWPRWAMLAWAIGAATFALGLWRQHARYLRQLGPLSSDGELAHAASAQASPALVGLWRPMIVLPADFERRYTPQQQALIIAHERAHRRRGDPLCNALAALAQCLLWHDPLVHLAMRWFRFDQELACDAAVIAQHPGERRRYAEAMLNTQLSQAATPLGCHWLSHHPLKERIMQLQHTSSSLPRRIIGTTAVLLAAASAGFAVWAAETPANGGGSYFISFSIERGDQTQTPKILTPSGTLAKMRQGWKVAGTEHSWELLLTPRPDGDGEVAVEVVQSVDGKAQPGATVHAHLGESVALPSEKLGEGHPDKVSMIVTKAAK